MRAFIYDEKFIKITDDNGNEFKLYLINFKTYKDYFGHLSKELFDDYKNDYINLLNGIIKSRERRKKNLKQKENDYLKKKRNLE